MEVDKNKNKDKNKYKDNYLESKPDKAHIQAWGRNQGIDIYMDHGMGS